MDCGQPGCTGVHDNNRWRELCPWAIERKREKDRRYYRRNPLTITSRISGRPLRLAWQGGRP